MIFYNGKINKALNVCYKAHKGQADKSYVPYVFHPFMVANLIDNPTANEIITALLHDILEDCPEITAQDWFNCYYATLDDEVKEALNILTHDKELSYDAYIFSISQNKIATKVKIADLKHNMMLDRLDGTVHASDVKTLTRYYKYRRALDYLINNGEK